MENIYNNDNKYNSPDEILAAERQKEALDIDYEVEDVEMSETDDEIIDLFQQNSALMIDHWEDIYSQMEEDWNIYTLDQWSETGKNARGKRPKVTMDITRKFVKSVAAETFRNPPGVKLTARREDSSAKAKAMADAIRYFEDRTGAIYGYSHAKECAACAGLGWLKVTYRYDEQQSMPAVIDVDRIQDPLSIMIDPDSVELDGSDALFAMEIHGETDGSTQHTYWWKDDSGEVKWALIKDNKTVSDKGIFPTSEIPLVPVYGEVYNIRNVKKVFGIVRQLVDVQRSHNYTLSEGIEQLALTPKNPIKAVENSIPKQYMNDWQRSMTEPVPILFWNNKSKDGTLLPEPSRGQSTPDVGWVPSLIQSLQMNAKETTGIYDTALGQNGNEQSGVAIKAKAEQGDRGHLVYDEHLQISIKQVGRLMLDLLEPVVGPAGILPILSEEGKTSILNIGKPIPQLDQMGNQLFDRQTGMAIMLPPEISDLDPSDVDISISSAPAYATRKQEGLDTIIRLLPSLPQDMSAKLIPKIIGEMDFPGASDYSSILGGGDKENNSAFLQQQLQEIQAQMTQMTQSNANLQSQNQQLQFTLDNNTNAMLSKAEMDNNTKLTMKEMDIQSGLVEIQMKLDADSQSDNKGFQKTVYIEEQKNQREMSKLMTGAEKANEELRLKSEKQQQDLIDKIEVQPVAIVTPNVQY